MKAEYDFSKAKRAKDVPHLAKLQSTAVKGKTRVTIFLDDSILETFRFRAEVEGKCNVIAESQQFQIYKSAK